MTAFLRIFLVLTLLLSGRGMSVCYDGEGHGSLCAPEILKALSGHSGDPCDCPCEDDCQEHEVTLDSVLSTTLEVPQPATFILPLVYESPTALRLFLLPEVQEVPIGLSNDDSDSGSSLTDELLGTIVLRV